MNVKQAVVNNVKNMLMAELDKCNYKIHDNKYKFARLTEEQTVLKRERVKLTEMLKDLN